jgi:DNA-binding CsgD family transcriptional regulator
MSTLSDLKPRDTDVLQCILIGKTNKAIATEICVTEKTVEFHLHHIYTKIGVAMRPLAGMWAIQQGIEILTRGIPSYFAAGEFFIMFTLISGLVPDQ